MLPADHRLTRPASFRHAVRAGRRAGARTLVTHLAFADRRPGTPPRVGFVVGRTVGGAVVRNKVSRRLRHAVRARISWLPDGALLVVRAQPRAASASFAELAADLDRCLDRSLDTSPETGPETSSGRVEP